MRPNPRRLLAGAGLSAGLLVQACDTRYTPADLSDPTDAEQLVFCSIPVDEIVFSDMERDDPPPLSDPPMVSADDAGAAYLRDDDRVIGFEVAGSYVAVPHNILWWHEIVNLEFPGLALAVTYSPHSGSSMVFDRAMVGGAEFGVSGLFFHNNLVMYDRVPDSSLWPQMLRGAGCGPRTHEVLPMYPAVEMRWSGWKRLHSQTLVVSAETGYERNYGQYPYGSYEVETNPVTRYPQDGLDVRRPPKERVLAIPSQLKDGETIDGGGVAFPFGELDNGDSLRVVHQYAAGRPAVVFWDRDAQGASAFYPFVGDERLAFEVREGVIVDHATGSEWTLEGVAVSGDLAGERLEPIPRAFVSFWFAWATFIPGTLIWEN